MDLDAEGQDLNRGEWLEDATPQDIAGLRSLLTLGTRFEIDAQLRYQTRIEGSPRSMAKASTATRSSTCAWAGMPPSTGICPSSGRTCCTTIMWNSGRSDAARRARTRRLSQGDLAQLTMPWHRRIIAVRAWRGIAPRLLLVACIVAASWCSGAWPAPPAGGVPGQGRLLFNFGQFVEWPLQAYDSPSAPFVIGVVGDDPFGKTLDEVVAGESLGGHPLVVRRFKNPEDISACNILFIGRSEAARLEETLKALQGPQRAHRHRHRRRGAPRRHHRPVNENNRIRMRINVAAAKANHLVISSKLLRPAEVVGNEGG